MKIVAETLEHKDFELKVVQWDEKDRFSIYVNGQPKHADLSPQEVIGALVGHYINGLAFQRDQYEKKSIKQATGKTVQTAVAIKSKQTGHIFTDTISAEPKDAWKRLNEMSSNLPEPERVRIVNGCELVSVSIEELVDEPIQENEGAVKS